MEVKDLAAYIHFTKEEKDQAANTDIGQFLLSRGEALIPSGKDKRLANDHSITIRGNEWFDHATQEGGLAISFVQRYYACGYAEAVTMLLGSKKAEREAEPKSKKAFSLPPANSNMRRIFAYLLKERAVDRDILADFVHMKLIYEDRHYHNAVFVGVDADGTPRHAHKRSTNGNGKPFRQNVEGSDPKHSFNYTGTDGSLYVFEATIDMLSYISMNKENWRMHSYVACCGTSPLPVLEMLSRLAEVKEVYICLDNDKAGKMAAEKVAGLIDNDAIYVRRLLPICKDWNDDLKSLRFKKRVVPQ